MACITNTMLCSEEAISVLAALCHGQGPLASSLQTAATEAGVAVCEIGSSNRAAMEMYIRARHDLVIIDRRLKSDAADSLLLSLRAVSQSEFTTFVAVTKCSSSNSSLAELQQIGYDLRLSYGSDSCLDLLLTCQQTCCRHQQKLSSLSALFSALDTVADAVEITDDMFRVQYVNAAYERMFGLPFADVVGRSSFEVAQVDKNDEETAALAQNLRKGKKWEGLLVGRRRSGASAEHHCCVLPVRSRRGKVEHFVSVKQPFSDRHRDSAVSRDSAALVTNIKGGSRKSSDATRTNSMTVEAPIHRVMSIIAAAQEAGPSAAAAALDKVLEILQRAPDLYSGELSGAVDDKLASGYVDGLMTGGCKPSDGKRQSLQHLKRVSVPSWPSLDEIPEDLLPYLQNDDEWSFDIIELERVTNKKTMVYLGMKTLRRFNICQLLNCNEDTMLRWLQVIQSNYKADNSYHNATHGADVMQCSAYFLERPRVKAVFDEFDAAASLLGALVHDVDHPGRTNPFLINSQHSLAILYNDISVLESHHASMAFQLTINDPNINIFAGLTRDEYGRLRHSIIDVVLATEMAKHFEHVTKFTNQVVMPLAAREQDDTPGNREAEQQFLESLTQARNQETRQLIKRVLIKCSDISNQCRPLKLCIEWSRRISEEYFLQTDEEKALSLPIGMQMFDRATCNLAETQVSFINVFLRDLLMAWHAFCDVPGLVENMNDNCAYWRQLAEAAAPSSPSS